MIDGLAIKDQEAVVAGGEFSNGDRRVLCIMLFQVLGQCLADGLGQYRDTDTFAAFGQLQQHTVVDVVIDQDDGFFGGSKQVIDEYIGIEDLAVEEDALGLAQALLFQSVEYPIKSSIGFEFVAELPFFQRVHALKQAAAGS